MPNHALSGKVSVITGGSSGIGAATAAVFAELGASVAIGYYRHEAGANEIVSQMAAAGHRIIAIKADLRRSDEIRAMMTRASDELGPIDVLVNNAGSLVKRYAIHELTQEGWDEILALNLTSAAVCSQAVAASMIARRAGAIVNVSSIASHTGGGPGASAYAAAKAGLVAFTKNLARELAPHSVRVNAVSPGVIDTPFHQEFSTPQRIRDFVAAIPLGRMGTAFECASVIAFLASEAASYIVGETIEVNGGLLMR